MKKQLRFSGILFLMAVAAIVSSCTTDSGTPGGGGGIIPPGPVGPEVTLTALESTDTEVNFNVTFDAEKCYLLITLASDEMATPEDVVRRNDPATESGNYVFSGGIVPTTTYRIYAVASEGGVTGEMQTVEITTKEGRPEEDIAIDPIGFVALYGVNTDVSSTLGFYSIGASTSDAIAAENNRGVWVSIDSASDQIVAGTVFVINILSDKNDNTTDVRLPNVTFNVKDAKDPVINTIAAGYSYASVISEEGRLKLFWTTVDEGSLVIAATEGSTAQSFTYSAKAKNEATLMPTTLSTEFTVDMNFAPQPKTRSNGLETTLVKAPSLSNTKFTSLR